VAKNKLQHFEELHSFKHCFEGITFDLLEKNHDMYGKWDSHFFKNGNPIVLELGCGKGEYTLGLARKYPNRNFIGVDIKGARMWRGAKTALEEGLSNVAFYRGPIEFITKNFDKNEISEIWITFPDPQKKRYKKRLTSARFLEMYKQISIDHVVINLKTDSKLLHFFTNELIKLNDLEVEITTKDLYNSEFANDELSIKTFYEKKYLGINDTITYTRFKLNTDKKIVNPDTFEAEKQFDK